MRKHESSFATSAAIWRAGEILRNLTISLPSWTLLDMDNHDNVNNLEHAQPVIIQDDDDDQEIESSSGDSMAEDDATDDNTSSVYEDASEEESEAGDRGEDDDVVLIVDEVVNLNRRSQSQPQDPVDLTVDEGSDRIGQDQDAVMQPRQEAQQHDRNDPPVGGGLATADPHDGDEVEVLDDDFEEPYKPPQSTLTKNPSSKKRKLEDDEQEMENVCCSIFGQTDIRPTC
jgi:hypothetical protein